MHWLTKEQALNGTIRECTTSGALVDPALITGLGFPTDVEAFNGDLFVLDAAKGTIGKYTMSGDPLNPTLVEGLNTPIDMTIVSNSAVPDPSSTWMLLLLGVMGVFPLRRVLRYPNENCRVSSMLTPKAR